MDDDKAGNGSHATSVPPSGPRRRPAPTIDLTASDVTETASLSPAGEAAAESDPAPQSHVETQPEADAGVSAGESQNSDSQNPPSDDRRPSPSLLVPALTGAATAAMMIGAALLLGWPQATVSPPAVQDTAAIDALGARLARVEAKASAPAPVPAQNATADPALTARLAALDTALTALHGDLGKLRVQSDAADTAIAALKAAPREAAAPPQDLSAIEGRLGKLETATAALATPQPRAAAVNEAALSRLAAATLLDQAVHQSEPYAAALAAVAKLNVPPALLQPLEAFASTGVPSMSTLGDELLKQLPNLAPQAAPQPDTNAASDGILDRLQHSAAKLVRIQRIDDAASARLALIARIKTAAERGDISEARRALLTLSDTDRAPVQSWLGRVAARDAALAASHKIAQQALAALAQPATSGTPR